jgi:hypothetical protein
MASSTYHGYATDEDYYRSLGVTNSNFENNSNYESMGPSEEEIAQYYKNMEDEDIREAEKTEYVEINPFTMKKGQIYYYYNMGGYYPKLFRGFKEVDGKIEVVFSSYLPSDTLENRIITVPIKGSRFLQKREVLYRKEYENLTGQSGQPGHGPANTILQYANLMKPYPKSRKSRKSRKTRKNRKTRKSRMNRKARKN